jgi:PIN domain nuclease of toxin-antitoxin system
VILLLDTHVVLWALLAPERLAPAAVTAISDPANQVWISAVVAWEIAIKQSLGKLELPGPAESWLPPACAATGFGWLPVTADDALRVRGLPWHHRDPFDRLLVAQIHGGRRLVTADRLLAPYGIPLLSAV